MNNSQDEILIYFATLKDGDAVYVGQTNRTLEQRREEHERYARQGKIGLFYDTLRDEGIKRWHWKTLESCPVDKADERERFYIKTFLDSGVNILNVVHARKERRTKGHIITDTQKQNRASSSSIAGYQSWENLDSDKWRHVDGKIRPVVNLKKNVRYRSISEAEKHEQDCKSTIIRSCNTGCRTLHNNLYAWLELDGNPRLTKYHEIGGSARTKRVKELETGKIYESVQVAAKAYNISPHCVQSVCQGGYNATKSGLVFCYVDQDNIELLTNRHKQYARKKLDNANSHYAVYPVDTDYKKPLFIRSTLVELCELLKIPSSSHAKAVCNGERHHHMGFRFAVYDRVKDQPILTPKHESKSIRTVQPVMCLDDKIVFPNPNLAAKHYKLQRDQIRLCCIGKLKTTGRGGVPRKFAYVDKNGNPILTLKHTESLAWRGERVFCPEKGKIYQSLEEFCRETGVPKKRAKKHLKDPETSLLGLSLHRVK